MQLVRDILDCQVIDRRRLRVGKVDGIVLVVDDGGQPRVGAIEIGAVTLARRIHPAFGSWVRRATRGLGVGPGDPLRVPVAKVRRDGINLRADIDRDETPAFAWERWLRDHVIGRIPGSGR